MHIIINDSYEIRSDESCFTLNRFKVYGKESKKAGQSYSTLVGHYPNLSLCVARLLDQVVDDSTADSLRELLEENRRTGELLLQKIEEVADGGER